MYDKIHHKKKKNKFKKKKRKKKKDIQECPSGPVVKNPSANAGDMGLGGLRELVMDREA